ncbi:MAG: regulatory protein ArsR [Devosia sp.]|nr:regulatory protein ArsR [Devosia sp.]
MPEPASIDVVLRALADPTRRELFERIVGTEEISVVQLTAGSGVSQGAVSQHLKRLKAAGLVLERPDGRKTFYRARPDGFEPLFDWMTHYGVFWRQRLGALRSLLQEIDQ